MRTKLQLAVLVALAAGAVGGVGAAPAQETFAGRTQNPWFPLVPGTRFVYQGMKDGEAARDVVTVTHRTKVIEGVRCTVVHDELYLAGRLAERTDDWYARKRDGSVWYFGEATAELDRRGRVTTTEGSWQAGADGALAGVYMPARPKVGLTFRQEYWRGHAEDHFRVVSLDATVKVPYTSSQHGLLTTEWSPLEPGVVDHKLYVRGVGLVKEETVKGGQERVELVSVRRG